jgi:signal transduction histidine kinase/ligand-binding sensor domain-containing protein
MRFLSRRSLLSSSVCGWIVLCVLIGAAPLRGLAADVVPLFSQRNWHRGNGLPSNEVTGLCIDRTGYLWVATATGLARFDGTRFINHAFAPAGPNSPSGFTTIAADPADDGLWAAPRAGGLMRFRRGNFEPFALPEEFSRRPVAAIFFASDSALWLTFFQGDVLRLHAGKWERFDNRHGLRSGRITHVARDADGKVWLANGSLLASYENGSLRPLVVDDRNDDLRIASARQEGLWVLGRGWLYKVVKDQVVSTVKVSADFNAFSVQALMEDSKGAIWTGTRSRGVRRLILPDRKSDLAIGTPEDIGALLEDASGNIWAGSNGGGLVRVRSGVLRRFDKAHGLLESHSLSVCQDNAGTIWLANRDGGVAFINPEGRVRTLNPLPVRETFTAFSIAPMVGPEGIWVSSSSGLLRANQRGLMVDETLERPPQPPDHGEMRISHVARNGDLWLALAPGRLGRLRNKSWKVFSEKSGLGPAAIQAIAEDRQSRIWVGTDNTGLYHFEDEHFTSIPLDAPAAAGAIQAIHFDAEGRGWFGTAGAGLLRLDAKRSLDDRHGLPAKNITQVISDDNGALWFGSPEGIFHVRRDALENFFAGRDNHVDAVIVGVDEGLNEATCLGAHQPSVWKDRSGILWFATRQGLVALDPRRDTVPTTPLVVEIAASPANGITRDGTGAVRLSRNSHTVEIDYSVLCLSTPERVRARTRLRGYDDDWTPADIRGLARYTRLPPGKYVFEVATHVAGAVGTAATAFLPVVVEAAWWQTFWFRLVAAGAGLLAIVQVARVWSHRRLRARLSKLERDAALEQERARIAQNIHDELGAGLTRISLLTQSDAPGAGRTQLDKIYNTVSGLTQSMDEIVWAVNPKNDDLESLANYLAEFAQGFLADAGIRCRVLLPDFLPHHTLPTQCRHHLFLSCKEALHNVVKHAHATEVSLQLSVQDSARLVIVITDNGRGFPASGTPPDVARLSAGNGLANMRSRLAALNGTCEISSSAAGVVVTFTSMLSSPAASP